MKKDYLEFLKTKHKNVIHSGFDINENELNPLLFEFQKFTVRRALKAGKYAVFADTGQGKTPMQLDIAYQVHKYTNKPVLILAPLAVTGQTIEQGIKFNIEVKRLSGNIQIANYEQIDNIDCSIYGCIILDESSILKNEMGKYRNILIEKFKNTPYKFCFSATPSPNDPMELGNHAEFLDVMSFTEMLAMYFVHDAGETQKWRLKGHAIERFYEFVSSWAIMYSHPRDIGYDMPGFDLPELSIIEKQVSTALPEGLLFSGLAVNATDYNSSLRETEKERIKQTIEIVNSIGKNEPIIIWTKQNEEAKNIYNQLTSLGYDCRNVQGSDSMEKKERELLGFAHNDFQILITKQSIASQGLNYQNCAYQIFNSVDFSFEQSYQAMRRSWRFGQKRKVTCYMITTDRMINVIKIQQDKHLSFKTMQYEMTKAVNKNINNQITNHMKTSEDIKTNDYWLMRGDCVEKSKEVQDNNADLIVFSPPFSELYTYSSHVEDMGNSANYDQFEQHFKYLIPELSRILKPGRICAIHCMDLPIQKGKEGYIGLRDFSGMLIKWFQDCGFIYHSRATIWKDPVIEMQRTKALGLLHKQIKKDSSMCRVGIPDYILFFRNAGDNEIPIANTHIPVDLWQKIASPVWYDIDYSRTLNYREGRANEDEKHICPLQLDTIERIILLYSNEGETVFSPFGGIGSEGYQALKMNRKSISIELKESYFELNKRNHNAATEEKGQLKLEW
jgi:DNA modification methylase/superfamily II DNA or RNA helicase